MGRSTGYAVMVPLLGVLAILQSTLAPRLAILGIKPDLMLIAVVVVTLVQGSHVGLIWAFTGGIWLDLMGGGPLGGSSLALMAAVLVAGIGHHRFFFQNPLVPFMAGLLAGVTYGASLLALLWLFQELGPVDVLLERLVLPAAVYDAALMLLATPWLLTLSGERGVNV